MRKFLAAVAVVLAVGGMTACSSNPDEAAVTTTVQSSTKPSPSKTTTPASSAAEAPKTSDDIPRDGAVSVPPAASVEVQTEAADQFGPPTGPSFVQCQMADGTALMSDGSTSYMDSCNESAGGPYLDLNGNPIGPSAGTADTATLGEPELYPGWHCSGPAYLCRDDDASGKTAGQGGY